MTLLAHSLAKCGQDITLQNRNIKPPVFGSVDAGMTFSGDNTVQAIVKTERGKTLFDGVSIDQVITHRITLEFIVGVTAETWILFNGRRFDILDVENCGEKDEVLILRCNDRGTQESSKA